MLSGHNGSGKTMLLRMISGLINPDKGSIEYNGKKSFGVIIENPTFFLNESAIYNLRFLASINNDIKDEEIITWLKIFNLYEFKNKLVKSFSLGMKQRLALCQAFMENPDILLLDEPFNGIDEENLKNIYDILQKEKGKNKIIVIASHVHIPVEGLVDTYINMSDGKIIV